MRRASLAAVLLLAAPLAWAEDANVAALMSAAYTGSLSDVKAALKKGVDLNNVDDDGETALMYAITGGHDAVAKLLLDKGADVDALSSRGDTALFYAALKDKPSSARLLLDRGAKTELRNFNGATPLIIAASRGSLETAKVLLQKGADPNGKSAQGQTALMTAAQEGRAAVADLLLEKGAEVNARDDAGQTALIVAAFKGHAEIVRSLVDKGADVAIADRHGETAVEYATAAGNDEAAGVIHDALAKISADREAQEQAVKDREAQAKLAEQTRLAQEEQRRRELEAKKTPLWVYAAGGAVLLLIGALGAGQALKKRAKAAVAEREAAIAQVRSLLSSQPEKAHEALSEYQRVYRDTSVFTPDELLRIYEARDRARRASPERAAVRAEQRSRESAALNIRGSIERDPQGAYQALGEYARQYGDVSAFTGKELGRLYELCGRDGELASGSLQLNDEQLIELAVFLSGRDRNEAALRLVSAEPLFSATIRLEEGCDQVIGLYDKAGVLAALFDALGAKSHEVQSAYGRAFLWLGRPRDALRLLSVMRVKDGDDQALMAAALANDGRPDEAGRAVEGVSKAGWSFAGWSSFFNYCLKTGRREESGEALDHIHLLRPLRRDPKLHYAMGLACESAGRQDLAGEIFHGFSRAGLPYKDAMQRAARLPKPPDATHRKVERDEAKFEHKRVGGRYDLRAPLGEDALGQVWSAYDSKRDRKARVRQVAAALVSDPRERARFLHEAKLISKLDHPALLGVRELIEEGSEVFLAGDFPEGEPLSAILAQRKRLPLSECKALLEKICQAVDHAHLRNVEHGRLAPSGVIVGADRSAKVLDFGLLRLAPGAPADSPYLAPEQARGELSRAADVYALGAILYEMAVGRPAFSGADMAARKASKSFASPHSLVSALPKELDAALNAVFEPDPKNRVADALEFYQEIKRL